MADSCVRSRRIVCFAVLTVYYLAGTVSAEIRGGVAEAEITPPVGLEIQHYFRQSVGVHDPLFARCLYLADTQGFDVAIISLDLIFGSFEACDQLRREIDAKTGVKNVLINFSHSHSSCALGPRGRSQVSNDPGSAWNDQTLDTIIQLVSGARESAESVELRAGRAPVEIGYNRRLLDKETGRVYMGVNREGPRVPWVNTLVVNRRSDGRPLSVLFETAVHPVIVPDTTKKISADFPGAAVAALKRELGPVVIPMFVQGCAGNVNGFPLRSSYENAIDAGEKLAESVMQAIRTSRPVSSKSIEFRSKQVALPSTPFPSREQIDAWLEENQDDPARVRRLEQIRQLVMRGETPPSRRFDVSLIAFGRDWCLTAMPHEMFCQYELWIDQEAPFDQTMTLAYTNGYEGYIAIDEALKMGAKGGYEAASLPNWSGQVHTRHFGPPAVGCEKIIKETIASLWPISPIEPAADAPQPLSPDQSKKAIRLPDDVRIDLLASEPIVQDPSCVAFDEHGRMFVCELHGYNIEGHLDVTELNKTGKLDKQVRRIRWELQGGPVAEAAKSMQFGKVKLLQDSDGDGVMDKAVVWADDLPPCYGIIPANGGIIVACAPDIVYLADVDHDGKPDVRETLLTGFKTQVMERGINNPRWGFDNWIYVGAGGTGGTITGPRLSKPVELRHSDFRIRPDGTAIEPVNGRVGTFGMTINEVGDRFPASGGQPATYALPIPYRYLARNPYVPAPPTNFSAANYNRGFRRSQPHPWRIRRRQDPNWIKFYGERETNSNYFSGGCSNEIYQDRLLPEKYRGNLFYCEPSLNIVHRCIVRRDGSGYRAERAPEELNSEFLASTDQWFRPMNLRSGPDGSLIVVDMYREIIEDYSAIPRYLQQQYGLNRGAEHGRIWRISPADSAPFSTAKMSEGTSDELVHELNGTVSWRRMTAQRLLVERRAAEVPDLIRACWTGKKDTSPAFVMHALYILDELSALSPQDVSRALSQGHLGPQIHAMRLSEPWLDSEPALRRQVIEKLDDPDARIRLQAVLSLGEWNGPRLAALLSDVARRRGQERWMDAAILSSSVECAGDLLRELLSVDDVHQGREILNSLARTVAGKGDAKSMSVACKLLARHDRSIQKLCLSGFNDGLKSAHGEPLRSNDGFVGLADLLNSPDDAVRSTAVELASKVELADRGQLARIFGAAKQTALSREASVQDRTEAFTTLSSADFDELAKSVQTVLSRDEPDDVQIAAIRALAVNGQPSVGRIVMSYWQRLTPPVRSVALDTLVARSEWRSALLNAIEQAVVAKSELSSAQREILLSASRPEVSKKAATLLADPAESKRLQETLARYQQADFASGEPDRGRILFQRHCASCHRVGSLGVEVGPTLGTILTKPNSTIVADIIDPSGRVEPEYRSYIVATNDGLTYSGLLRSDSATSVELVQAENKTSRILRRDIEFIKASDVSLMPANLHEQISPQQMADLISFLRAAFTEEAQIDTP